MRPYTCSVPSRTRKEEVDLPNQPSLVSLFSGCGGLDLGFERAGFSSRAMLELTSYGCETLRSEFPKAKVVGPPKWSGDINDGDAVAELPVRGIDVLIGGPPCQSFSIAAAQRFLKGDKKFKRTGFKDRKRGGLIHRYLEVLAETRPAVFVIENVPGLMNLDGGKELGRVLDFCADLGYRVAEPTVIQAADYGVPQYRQRLIIVGAHGKGARTPILPPPTHTGGKTLFTGKLLPHITVAEALAGLSPNAANHVPRQHNESSVARYRRLRFGQREHLGRVDRLDPRRPSKTVIAGGMNGGGRSHLHPYMARTLTVRECARLQTFPDDFHFYGNMSRQFTQVGNAVPPLLAEVIARAIGSQYFGLKYDSEMTLRANLRRWSVERCARQLLNDAMSETDYTYEDILAS